MADDTENPEKPDAFDAAFAEFSGGTIENDDKANTDTGTAGAGGGDADERQANQGQQDGDQGGGSATNDTETHEDPWATAPEPLKAAWQAAQSTIGDLTHKFNSANGRISALTRKVNELTATQAVAPTGDAKKDAKAAGEAADNAQSILDDPEFKAFREEYPEVAKPLEKALTAITAKNDQLERELSTITTDRREQFFDRQESALATKHPDWREATASPQFAAWYTNAPPYMKAAVERHAEHIGDAEEVAHILNTFKLETGFKGQTQSPGGAKPQGSEAELSAKRKKQLESSTGAAGKGAGAPSGAPNDFESAFAYFAGKSK
jgi:hypothetical protein